MEEGGKERGTAYTKVLPVCWTVSFSHFPVLSRHFQPVTVCHHFASGSRRGLKRHFCNDCRKSEIRELSERTGDATFLRVPDKIMGEGNPEGGSKRDLAFENE